MFSFPLETACISIFFLLQYRVQELKIILLKVVFGFVLSLLFNYLDKLGCCRMLQCLEVGLLFVYLVLCSSVEVLIYFLA